MSVKFVMDSYDQLFAYNGLSFDIQVLEKYFPGNKWIQKMKDPFDIIKQKTKLYVSLDNLAKWNGLAGKTENGKEAP